MHWASFSQTAFSVHYHVLQMHSDKIVDCFHFEANSQNYKAHRRKVCLGTEACEVSVKINNGLNPHINPVTTFSSIQFNSIQFNSIQLYFAMYTDTRNLFWYSPCRL